jgi:type I restriction enzyme, S subunit
MTLPRYETYKNSGQTYLGAIPEHWTAPPLYLRYSVDLGKMLDAARITGSFTEPYLRNVDVQWGRINLEGLPTMDIEPAELERYSARNGDLLVCEGGEVGRAAIVQGLAGAVGYQKALHRLRARSAREDSRFMFYTLRWAAEHGVFEGGGQSTIAHLTGEQFRKYRFPTPPVFEQNSIAEFLDGETGKIDALIAEQEKLVALLAEKRQATISHAVTRGLRPEAAMKESGVAHLGKVPRHWAVGKCRFYLTILSGYAFPSADFSIDDKDTKLLRGINVGVATIRWNEVVYWSRSPNDRLEQYELQDGDLVIGMDRPLISEGMRVAQVQRGDLPCLLLQRVAKLETGPLLLRAFLIRLLSSEMFASYFSPDMTGVSVPHISPEQIGNFVIPIPPVSEQEEIAIFITAEIGKLDALTCQSEHAIALLKERRSALVTAAVTGQIDVRGQVHATTPDPVGVLA